MQFSISVASWAARAPSLTSPDEWQTWAENKLHLEANQPLAKSQHLPMMLARRLSPGSRAAVDLGLELMQHQPVDALVFSSRHGELDKNLRIFETLHQQQDLSPTVFAMSVHNTAAGTLTISAQAPLTSTAISAGIDSFQQAVIKSYLLLASGYKKVLLVDYDSQVPEFFLNNLPSNTPSYPYACAFILEVGEQFSCSSQAKQAAAHPETPQSLVFLQELLLNSASFNLDGETTDWHWSRQVN